MTRKGPTKVLIVDDSAVIRSTLARVLSKESDIEVVGGACDPFEAREIIISSRPDVIILDIEMPRMDGITFLGKLREHYPVPVIMCSGVAPANSAAALRAIELGAIDIVAKPSRGGSENLRRLGEELADKIRAAAIAMSPPPPIPAHARRGTPQSFRECGIDPDQFLVVIGASTGGTEAIKDLLSHVPADFPPIAIVQHMPQGFTRSFAERLDGFSAMTVSEATDGETLRAGHAVVAPGGTQMAVTGTRGHWRVVYGSNEPFNRHCPSVDVLFDSAVKCAGKIAVGVLLTGMGADGANGLCTLRRSGAITVAQSAKSCVVYGMPKVAIEMGGAEHIAAPPDVPGIIFVALAHRLRAARKPTAAPRGARLDRAPVE